jgi:hypothetical protein
MLLVLAVAAETSRAAYSGLGPGSGLSEELALGM